MSTKMAGDVAGALSDRIARNHVEVCERLRYLEDKVARMSETPAEQRLRCEIPKPEHSVPGWPDDAMDVFRLAIAAEASGDWAEFLARCTPKHLIAWQFRASQMREWLDEARAFIDVLQDNDE